MGLKTVYWDASVFHALFNKEQGRDQECLRIEKAARDGRIDIYTSAVTFVECIWLKGSPKLSPKHEEFMQKYFMHKFITVLNCDRLIAESARSLAWKYPHLHPKDAIHVASAISQQVDVLHSYDADDLIKLDGKIGAPPLKICKPGDEGFDLSDGLLFQPSK